jgi:hypothetical protein
MILNNGHSTQYLNDYLEGKVPKGLKLGCDLDDYYVHKHSQLNIILGHDNVGKTYFMEWYYLALATNHDLKFCLFMDENFHGKVMRDLIQMYAGKKFVDLTYNEVRKYEIILEQNFKFVDNTKRYSPDDLLNIFDKAECDVHLIDPFNGLKTPMSYSSNYDVLNDLKHFTKNGKTIYINAHPSSASGRRSAVYPEKHNWSGHVMPPLKSDIEGGKAFSNKADDFIVIHRLTQHPDLWNYTMLEVVKIKDTDTGGKPTMLNEPIMLDYNFGLGFKVGGKDVIKRLTLPSTKAIAPNNSFDNLPF